MPGLGMVPPRDAAVIDIGSNAVRMVLYRLEGRASWMIFNEKVLAGLGRDLPSTGRLSKDGAATALSTLRRFASVLEGVRPDYTFVAAPAAVAAAAGRPEFCARRLAAPGTLRPGAFGGVEGHYRGPSARERAQKRSRVRAGAPARAGA